MGAGMQCTNDLDSQAVSKAYSRASCGGCRLSVLLEHGAAIVSTNAQYLIISRASSQIDLRFIDRDTQLDIRDALAINGGHRVPVVVFLSEDGFEVSRYGERTLSAYRRLAADQLGSSCPTGLVPPSEEAIAALRR